MTSQMKYGHLEITCDKSNEIWPPGKVTCDKSNEIWPLGKVTCDKSNEIWPLGKVTCDKSNEIWPLGEVVPISPSAVGLARLRPQGFNGASSSSSSA